ncbi:Protein of unknown function [Jannaschia faecimaris]|uniref:DUF1203 domain-containing protein n=1 Tax=Jannaschia faecimaris TaxID=1244108 RepID=A0A1H3RLB2_9RHOB|nr:DUF1203 domain-containing protein [Jannaschia faecimaris]SDZ26487.1 Protein of unknown function [Jannaschia faecimaris]
MKFTPLDAAFVARIRAGGPDANGLPAETAVSTGGGTPCRSCLHDVPEGEEFLICAARPFPTLQPYAETGPIFLCKAECVPWQDDGVPPIMTTSPDYLIKGYTADHRIRYGTGQVVKAGDLAREVQIRLSDPLLAYVDVRSARNNCFQSRVVRLGDKPPDIR